MVTKAQALDHLTDVLAGEDVQGTPSIAGAINQLTDALAGHDVAGTSSIAGSIDKLADMIEDGEIVIGGGVTVESLTATENKTYTAPEGKAYSPVVVNVAGGSIEYGTAVNIYPRYNNEFYADLDVTFILSEAAVPRVGNIMGEVSLQNESLFTYGNVIIAPVTYDNLTATLTVNDGEPQPVTRLYDEEWDTYNFVFTVPNVTQEDNVYLDFANAE